MTFRFFSLAALSSALVFIAPGRAAAQTPPLTDGECAAFGRQIASWLSAHDMQSFRGSFDEFALLDRVIRGLDLSVDYSANFRSGVTKSDLLHNFKAVRRAHFLRVVEHDGEKRALVRVNMPGGINYFEFVCVRQASGKVKWIDAFTYSAGDTLSNIMRTAALPVIAESKKDLLDRLTGEESSYVKHQPEIQRAESLLGEGRFAEAAPVLNALPSELQTNRTVMLVRLRVMQSVDRAGYLKVIEDWERTYPNDPALALISIDGDALRKDFAGALKAVDTLDRLVGGDPYLNCLRANLYFAAKNYAAAKRAAAAALQADHTFFQAYDVLLNTSLAEKDYDETVKILEDFESRFPKADMAAEIKKAPVYAQFMLSPAYAEWIEHRSRVRGESANPP
jgi:tetratricopeptide (TPR) repeat protein